MKAIHFRLSDKEHHKLRKISFYTEIPMAELLREAMNVTLKKYEKILVNGDSKISLDGEAEK